MPIFAANVSIARGEQFTGERPASRASERERDEFTPLQLSGGKVSVTHLSSFNWCALRLYYQLRMRRRVETEATARGVARHSELEAQSHALVAVDVATNEEALGIKLLNTGNMIRELLLERGWAREFWFALYLPAGVVLRGVVDEICRQPNGRFLIKDTKTRPARSLPHIAAQQNTYLQLCVYHYMVTQLAAASPRDAGWERFFELYECDPARPLAHEAFGALRNLLEVLEFYLAQIRAIAALEPFVRVEYDCAGELFEVVDAPVDAAYAERSLHRVLPWWQGQRPTPVPDATEARKCRRCAFVDICAYCPLRGAEYCAAVAEAALEGALLEID